MTGRAAAQRLIVALDTTTLADALRLARRLRGLARHVKIGSALYTAAGPESVSRLRAMGFGVMLDLKFFDIPNTVELACRAAARLGVSLLTVHAAGGPVMLEAAMRGARAVSGRRRPRVVAVTVLTSTGAAANARRVIPLARGALAAGCDGVVTSPLEAAALRRTIRRRFLLICPGIRPAFAARGDQRRVATPGSALAAGADFLVVGRPITNANDPAAAARLILREMEEAC